MTDLIDRKAINKLRRYNLIGGMSTVSLEDINKLPSIKQEPCDDAISRNDMLDAVGHGTTYTSSEVQKIINGLPSAEKTETVTEFADRCRECGARYGKYRKEARRWKNKWLKSQKSGHWKRISMDRYTTHAQYWYECDKCGEHNLGNTDYCPSCGCRMVEPQEGEQDENR